MPSVVCPKCGADVLLPDRPVAKTCCIKCKAVFPVRAGAPAVPKLKPEGRARPAPRPVAAVPEGGSGAWAGRMLWLAALVPVLALGGLGIGWWLNRKPEPVPVAAVTAEEGKPVVNEAPAPVAAAPDQDEAAKAEVQRLAREKADREAQARQAEQEARVRADQEKAEQARRVQEEEDRLTDLWKRHGKNFVLVDGKFVRLPQLKDAVDWHATSVGYNGIVTRCKILKIKTQEEMIIGPYQGFSAKLGPYIYLKGFPTKGLIDGREWSGPEGGGIPLVVIGTTQVRLVGGGSMTIFLAIPVQKAKEGLSREEFRQLVKQEKDLGPDLEAQKHQADLERQERLRKQAEARKPKPPKPVKVATPEEDAALKLKLAKAMLRDADEARSKGDTAQVLSLKDKARARLKEITDKFPTTAAGKEAKELFEKLNQ